MEALVRMLPAKVGTKLVAELILERMLPAEVVLLVAELVLIFLVWMLPAEVEMLVAELGARMVLLEVMLSLLTELLANGFGNDTSVVNLPLPVGLVEWMLPVEVVVWTVAGHMGKQIVEELKLDLLNRLLRPRRPLRPCIGKLHLLLLMVLVKLLGCMVVTVLATIFRWCLLHPTPVRSTQPWFAQGRRGPWEHTAGCVRVGGCSGVWPAARPAKPAAWSSCRRSARWRGCGRRSRAMRLAFSSRTTPFSSIWGGLLLSLRGM